MDFIAQTQAGFAGIDADATLKERALANLNTWLTHPEGGKTQHEANQIVTRH